ncbi:hypothetical protein PTTG_04241 [Puccinia triticina 1-1 BBBD Race 1]|uniref:DDE Tnp4 domain-containing protein n=1 Tax=Puccinia triticina (isolate 1-1 / race 1 (BBBD)) TaxID=630390 RepID=A0A180GFU5_PUCT1|nr:hypothetical protein PTTG_04241 [Puccinia triticina 1-1 BBBD Race 1]
MDPNYFTPAYDVLRDFNEANKQANEDDEGLLAMAMNLFQGKRQQYRTIHTYLTRADLFQAPDQPARGFKCCMLPTIELLSQQSDSPPHRRQSLWRTPPPSPIFRCSRLLGLSASLAELDNGGVHTSANFCNHSICLLAISGLCELERYRAMIEGKFPLLTGCFGFVNGLNIPVLVSGDEDLQNAHYNGWTCSHYCSNVLTFVPNGTIIHAIINAPGSWHGSNIAEKLYVTLLEDTPPGYCIISDTAFPRKTPRLEQRILAPIKTGDKVPADPLAAARLLRLNHQLVSARQAAEWGMRSIQGSFARLKLPLPASDAKTRRGLLEIVCRLHQL